jgi:hypothetical protein
VVFAADIARGFFGHLVSAVRGSSQYRKSSFLVGAAGEQLLPAFVQMQERPHLRGALASSRAVHSFAVRPVSASQAAPCCEPLAHVGTDRHRVVKLVDPREAGERDLPLHERPPPGQPVSQDDEVAGRVGDHAAGEGEQQAGPAGALRTLDQREGPGGDLEIDGTEDGSSVAVQLQGLRGDGELTHDISLD